MKKAFFDGWDNLFALAAINSGYVLIFSLFLILPSALGLDWAAGLALAALGLFAFAQWHALTASAVAEMADYHSVSFSGFFSVFPQTWKAGLALGAALSVSIFSLGLGIPFYIAQKSFLGVFLASLLFWANLALILSLQYFMPLCAKRPGQIRRNMRISITLFFDNPGFTMALFIHTAISLVISIALAFLAPGFAGIALAEAGALKLRMLKYDWLEGKGPEMRRRVPWGELLAEEKELVGERTLKGMIFPWKEGK
ncbi:MAG TPA: hypothetical protein VIO60_09515 [Rectinemataceae bacterium]